MPILLSSGFFTSSQVDWLTAFVAVLPAILIYYFIIALFVNMCKKIQPFISAAVLIFISLYVIM